MVESDIDCSLDDVTKNVKEKAYITFKDALIHLCILCYIFDASCVSNKFEIRISKYETNPNFQIS